MKEPTTCEKCGRTPEGDDFIFVGLRGECTKAIGRRKPGVVQTPKPAGFWDRADRDYDRGKDK